MKSVLERLGVIRRETHEDFNIGAAIAMIVLLLTFIGASFYVLVVSYLDIS